MLKEWNRLARLLRNVHRFIGFTVVLVSCSICTDVEKCENDQKGQNALKGCLWPSLEVWTCFSACIWAALFGSIMTASIFYENISTLPVKGAEASLGFWVPSYAFSFARKNVRIRNPLCWFQAQLNSFWRHIRRSSFYRSSRFWPFCRTSYHPLPPEADINNDQHPNHLRRQQWAWDVQFAHSQR